MEKFDFNKDDKLEIFNDFVMRAKGVAQTLISDVKDIIKRYEKTIRNCNLCNDEPAACGGGSCYGSHPSGSSTRDAILPFAVAERGAGLCRAAEPLAA